MFANMPIDIKNIEPKLIFKLTKRQLICGAVAIIPASLTFVLFKMTLGDTIALIFAVAAAVPGFLLMTFKKNGMPAEQILKAFTKWKLIHPQIYKTQITLENKQVLKQRGII